MPIFMMQANYTAEAWAALIKAPEDRAIAANRLLTALGGRLLDFYFTSSDYDILVIFEAPDALTARSSAMVAFAAGHLKDYKLTALYSSIEALAAMEKAGSLTYDVPG